MSIAICVYEYVCLSMHGHQALFCCSLHLKYMKPIHITERNFLTLISMLMSSKNALREPPTKIYPITLHCCPTELTQKLINTVNSVLLFVSQLTLGRVSCIH